MGSSVNTGSSNLDGYEWANAFCFPVYTIVDQIGGDIEAVQEAAESQAALKESAETEANKRYAKELEGKSRKEAIDRNVTNAINEREVQNAAYQAARNQGLTSAEAQAIKGQSENSTKGNATNIGAALRSTGQSTQNDWLEKQGYAKGLGMQADNLRQGAFLNTLGAIFGGAGTGASVGASIGGGSK